VRVPKFKRWIPLVVLFAWWGFTATRMVLSARYDHGPTGLAGDLPNWHNRPGELWSYLALTLVEGAALLAILRPRSYEHSWRRAMVAGTVITPWLLLFGAMMIHSGGIMVMHFVWLGALWAGMWFLAGISGLLELAREDGAHRASHLTYRCSRRAIFGGSLRSRGLARPQLSLGLGKPPRSRQ
jgi:hypothetical protein